MSSLLLFRLLKLSFIMFSLNLVDYPMFSLLLSTWNDLGHLPNTQVQLMMFSFNMLDYPIQLEETGKVGYWATWYDFH